MSEISSFIVVLVGLLLRVGVPVAITLGVVVVLRQLDARWQSNSEEASIPLPVVRNSGCWKAHNCAPEAREKCPAYQHQESPCWQVFRDRNGVLQERCIGCDVFRQAPIPMAA